MVEDGKWMLILRGLKTAKVGNLKVENARFKKKLPL